MKKIYILLPMLLLAVIFGTKQSEAQAVVNQTEGIYTYVTNVPDAKYEVVGTVLLEQQAESIDDAVEQLVKLAIDKAAEENLTVEGIITRNGRTAKLVKFTNGANNGKTMDIPLYSKDVYTNSIPSKMYDEVGTSEIDASLKGKSVSSILKHAVEMAESFEALGKKVDGVRLIGSKLQFVAYR